MKISQLIVLLLMLSFAASAQITTEKPADTLAGEVKKIKADLDILKKIKLSGYVQAQFQRADSSGIASFSGGDFPANVNNRFRVRRAEFKTMYDNGVTQIVANIDITQNGVNIKDAYGRFTEQKFKAISFTAGIFNRPFGFEVPYSSGLLETPERSRIIQVLFPGERDGGAMLTFKMPSTSKLSPLKVDLGLFNGVGNNANDFDSVKDVIGSIHWNKTLKSEKFSYGLGASYYSGGRGNGTKFVYEEIGKLPNGNTGFIVDSADKNKNGISKRSYAGVDAQLSITWVAGVTTLRGEYIQGQQPGTSSSSTTPATRPTSDSYNRQISGGYVYFIQTIRKSKHQVVVKYDWYDPNTKVSGDDIGKAGSKLTGADIKYTTLAFAWVYQMNPNVKWTLHYDMVTNEKSANLTGFTKDIKDNVITLRAQFKF